MGGPPPPTGIEAQTYCLRWNNHKSNLVEILDALAKVESYVDCTIVVDDQVQFKAHRVVLAANSPYFQAILQDVPMDHCSIIFPGVKAFEMRALLEYMYTGEVNVTQSQIPKIMRIAEELEVKGLFDMADLKEKFNKFGDEAGERGGVLNPYSASSSNLPPYSTTPPPQTAAMHSSSSGFTSQNGGKEQLSMHHSGASEAQALPPPPHLNSSSVISTSSNISSSVLPSSSSSPPYSTYKSPYHSNLYSKSPGPSTTSKTTAPQTSTNLPSAQSSERGQWPLSPSTTAAMLSSVYESAPDMNPLKRKKLSSLSSMLMNRDTPILRNVLAQSSGSETASSTMPLLLPGAGSAPPLSATAKTEKPANERSSSPHSHAAAAAAAALASSVAAGSGGHNNSLSQSFNGSDYSSDKKYVDEAHSPYTDRSFDDEAYEPGKGSGERFSGNFGPSNSNQKPEWKRYKQYTRNDIMSAIQCVRDGMSALQASRKFGVPSRTLYDKVKKLGITTGRPMNRTLKRSPSGIDSSAAFPYAHSYGPNESMMTAMNETRDEREANVASEHHSHHRHGSQHPSDVSVAHHLASGGMHRPSLLDHAFLQQAFENRGDLAGREAALHAMALAAAAHAAAANTRLSPNGLSRGGTNENARPTRSPSPANFSMKYSAPAHNSEDDEEMMIEHERRLRRTRQEMRNDDEHNIGEDDDDQVEDLSVARKNCASPNVGRATPSPLPPTTKVETYSRPASPYSPPPSANQSYGQTSSAAMDSSEENEHKITPASGGSVIVPPIKRRRRTTSSNVGASTGDDYANEAAASSSTQERNKELLGDDDATAVVGRAAD